MTQPPPGTHIAARVDARENRQRLIEAARAALHEHGFNAEITDIAARADVGVGTVYRHFDNKEALLRLVVVEIQDRVQRDLAEIYATVPDAREAVRRTMAVGFRCVAEYGRIVVDLVAGTAPPQYRGTIDLDLLARHFGALLKRGIEQGHFRRDLDVEYAVAVWFALVAPNALDRLLQTRTLDQIAATTTRFFLAGCADTPCPRGAAV